MKGAGERMVLPHAGLLPAALLALDKDQAELPVYIPAYLEGGNVATPRYKPQTVWLVLTALPSHCMHHIHASVYRERKRAYERWECRLGSGWECMRRARLRQQRACSRG